MANLRLVNLSKRFEDVQAIKALNLEIEDGELMVLLGPTGAGKTTTLRSVAGLEPPEEGQIFIDEVKVNKLPPAERDVAFVFQNYSLYPRYSVFENMASPLRARALPDDEIQTIVKQTAVVLHIDHLLERKPVNLSGGEMQRVAIGRALVRQPKIFLMDEPLSNLDAKLREEMRTELKRLQKDIKATFFYATPDQAEALSMADRIAVLRQGKIQQVGIPSEIYNHPRNTFIAEFVGSPGMNFLACVYDKKNMLNIGPNLFTLRIPENLGHKITEEAADSELIFGIRPEDISLSRERRANYIQAEMDVMESMGSLNIVSLKLGGHILKVKTDPDFEARPGDPLWVDFAQEKIHIFDKTTQ
ncbi:MAG: ABC transporter ATP-binding protein, partial [bacterium]